MLPSESVDKRHIPWSHATQVLEFGRCITSIRTDTLSKAGDKECETETSRRLFLGICKREDVLLDSTPLAPDDDIIINW